jgi:hypothetical protein
MSDIVLLGVILPPAYLKMCVYVRAGARSQKRNLHWIDQILSDVAHVIVKCGNCHNAVGQRLHQLSLAIKTRADKAILRLPPQIAPEPAPPPRVGG